MRTGGRLAALSAAVAGLLLVPGAIAPADASGTPQFTRVRITVTSSSDWTTVKLFGAKRLDQMTVSVAPGGQVEPGDHGFAFRMPSPATGAVAVVDEVLQVEPAAKPVLRIDKGNLGSVQVALDRTNTTATQIATLSTPDGRLPSNYIERSVDRAALVGESLSIAPVDSRRLVLAFYYPWFRSGSFDSGVWYDRPSGPYDTDDPTSIAAMVDQAQDAGVNGFIVSWDGSSTTADRFDKLITAAGSRPDFVVAPYLELVGLEHESGGVNVNSIADAARSALDRSSDSHFLRVDGRPVLFVYGSWTLQPAQWQQVLTTLTGAGYQPFVVGDGSDPQFGFNGYHMYNPNTMDDATLRTFDWNAARNARIPHVLHPDIPQQLWAATVSPGQNKLGRTALGGYRSRDGGTRYDQTWGDALASDPDWVLITSWNEWLETTQIQPSQQAGRRALDQTTAWAARFHAS